MAAEAEADSDAVAGPEAMAGGAAEVEPAAAGAAIGFAAEEEAEDGAAKACKAVLAEADVMSAEWAAESGAAQAFNDAAASAALAAVATNFRILGKKGSSLGALDWRKTPYLSKLRRDVVYFILSVYEKN
ncbi:hypothetical protein [Saccharibacillus brassicae]|uniref:Uncharacterized protein n=1 Tax=Saccharibacillus brassicae TaxID=2583377 RepID=A0A4Y6UUT3_SACBS|nr:hypothetical protein [Saccharibacillus brassicae]QDH21463.1 hypothetical protein FFV09_11805 [Saccharibacillus brassicae]